MRFGVRGVTLIEMLIACSLFLLSLILIGQLAVQAMTVRSQTEDKNQVFRASTIVLNQMQLDLEHAEEIYSPYSTSDLVGLYNPGLNAPSLVLRTEANGQPVVVGYTFSKTANTLTRLLYEPGYNPKIQRTQQPLKDENPKVALWVDGFTLNFMPRAQNYGTLVVETLHSVQTGTGPSLKLRTATRLKKM